VKLDNSAYSKLVLDATLELLSGASLDAKEAILREMLPKEATAKIDVGVSRLISLLRSAQPASTKP
jgi:hypothetical protein